MGLQDINGGCGTLAVEINCAGDNERMYCTSAFQITLPYTMTQAKADFLLNRMAQRLLTHSTNLYSISRGVLHYRDIPGGGPPTQVFNAATATQTGLIVTAGVPQNTAFLAHKNTGSVGRGANGRCYIPGVPEASVDALGNVTAGEVAALTGQLDQWRLDWEGGAPVVKIAVLHHGPGPVHALEPEGVVTSVTVDPRVATQRRRLRP